MIGNDLQWSKMILTDFWNELTRSKMTQSNRNNLQKKTVFAKTRNDF